MSFQETIPPDGIIGEYRIERALGRRGMCESYAAVHRSTGARVQLEPHPFSDPTGNPPITRLLQRRALASSAVDHPAVLKLLDQGEWRGHAYLVWEWVDGEDLSLFVRHRREVDWRTAVRIGGVVSDAMQVAHSRSVIHADLNPLTLLLARSPAIAGAPVKILDFVYPEVAPRGDDRGEAMAPFMGTPFFMSPEQVLGRRVDEYTDVYGLGAVLYYLLSRSFPHEGPGVADVLQAIVTKEPPPIETRTGPLPPEMPSLLRRMMAKDPAQRPTMGAVATALRQLGDGRTTA